MGVKPDGREFVSTMALGCPRADWRRDLLKLSTPSSQNTTPAIITRSHRRFQANRTRSHSPRREGPKGARKSGHLNARQTPC